jgi:hypothetical protein
MRWGSVSGRGECILLYPPSLRGAFEAIQTFAVKKDWIASLRSQ